MWNWHVYCEYSLNISHTDKEKAKALLQKALEVSPTCVRLSILLAKFFIASKIIKVRSET